ncbi:MAG: prolyl oligopeptidase family serine peptidase [Patescibacteria group bacterium]|nr:prolyl oligopeptidase family serine peptidase [Patescibacteria group bacterium]MDE2116658.1 prolyl oligopeptidase family serine peptidase [Patescibacteria group bacterium]
MSKYIKLPTGARARFVRAPGSRSKQQPAVIIVHGWKSSSPIAPTSSYAQLQQEFRRIGYHSLVICLRGHAPSAGDLTKLARIDHFDDVDAGLDWLKSRRDVDIDRLGGYGVSYGAYILAVISSTEDLHQLAFRVPALYPDIGWHKPAIETVESPKLRSWRLKEHSGRSCWALSALSHFGGRVQLVFSKHDEYMPPPVMASYCKACRNATAEATVMDAGHVLDNKQREWHAKLLIDWFARTR